MDEREAMERLRRLRDGLDLLVKMKAERKEAREIIRQLVKELTNLVKDEQCDHAVGICYCDVYIALTRAKFFLASPEEKMEMLKAVQAR